MEPCLIPTRPGSGNSPAVVRALLAAVLASVLCPAPVQAQRDDFNDANDVGWTQQDPIGVGSFTFVNGGYRIQSAVSSLPSVLGPGRAGSLLDGTEYGENFYLSVDLVNWDDSLIQAAGLLARVESPSLGTTTGYAFTWFRGTTPAGGELELSRITGERPTAIAPDVNDRIHLVPGRTYRLVFIGKGATLEGRIYELPDTTTAKASLTAVDSTYTTGAVGLLAFDGSATANSPTDITFDNFLAADVEPPRIEVTRLLEDLYLFAWPATPVEFVLQSSPRINAPEQDWVDVTGTIRLGDQDTYGLEIGSQATVTPPRFFRLKRKP